MVFRKFSDHEAFKPTIKLRNGNLKMATQLKYLGIELSHNLTNLLDIVCCRNKFYDKFNALLRTFFYMGSYVFLFLKFCVHLV